MLRLLEAAALPVAGVPSTLAGFYVAEDRGRVVGVAGLELYGADALLRSAAVDPAVSGTGIGQALVERVLGHARERGVRAVYLLTITAERYFPRFGFDRITREDVPDAVKASVEFHEACPASAVVMRRVMMEANDKTFRVLFLCTGNSARSQMAEKVLNRKGRGRFAAESAGSHPAAQVNPHAVETLERHGYFWTGGRPRGLDGLTERDWDFVITVCDRAREACPFFPGQPVIAHWGMPDPAAVEGSDEGKRRAFDDTLLVISRRIDLFLALPIEKLSRLALEQRVRDIGRAAAARRRPLGHPERSEGSGRSCE